MMRLLNWFLELLGVTPQTGAPASIPRRNRFAEELLEVNRHQQTGQREEAVAACRRLDALLKTELAGVVDPEILRDGSAALLDLGSGYRELGIRAESQIAYDDCLRLTRKLLERTPADPELIGRVAACHNLTGLLLLDHGEPGQAEGEFEQAIAVRQQLQRSHPGDELNRVYLAGAICNLGATAASESDFEKARARFEQSIELLDQEIPECECGCRDLTANLIARVTQQPAPLLIAQQFLWNAVQGRGDVLTRAGSGGRYQRVHCSSQEGCLVVEVLPARVCGDSASSAEERQTLRELRFDLLDAVTVCPGDIVFDLHRVEHMDAAAKSLLVHLQGRLVGSGRSLALVISSRQGQIDFQRLKPEAPIAIFDSVANAIAGLSD